MSPAPISSLTKQDRQDVIDVLTESFRDYPFFRYVLDGVEDDAYERQLRALVGFFVDARLMREWPVIGIRERETLVAALLLSDPQFKPRPEALNAVYESVAEEVGDAAIERLERFEAATAELEPESQTYFVGMIGVLPSCQGKGYGRLLMRHVEEMSRRRPESQGITLTTEIPKNIGFYESLGYRVLGSVEIGEITSWFFLLEH